MIKRRHSIAEILGKLAEAETLLAQGKGQQEVAAALDISIMTFHRWRRAYGQEAPAQPEANGRPHSEAERQQNHHRMTELESENLLLRRLVTDLLLEKIQLEESATPALRGRISRQTSHSV